MKKLLLLCLIFGTSIVVWSQDLAPDIFRPEVYKNVKECLVKEYLILPEYALDTSYMKRKQFYEFNKDGYVKEVTEFGGNDSYKGYYRYTYSDSLDQRIFYSNHNIITERLTTKYLNEFGDTDVTLYSWGGNLRFRTISSTDSTTHQTLFKYYNEAGYPLYTDLKTKFPDGRIEKVVTNDYDGYPVSFNYFNYNENNRLDSERKIDYLDTLQTVIEYNYDTEDRLLKKSTIDFILNKAKIDTYTYDNFGRVRLHKIYDKSNAYGGVETLVSKREFFYEYYMPVDEKLYKVDQAKVDTDQKIAKRNKKESIAISKMEKKDFKRRAKITRKELNELKKKRDKEQKKIRKENERIRKDEEALARKKRKEEKARLKKQKRLEEEQKAKIEKQKKEEAEETESLPTPNVPKE